MASIRMRSTSRSRSDDHVRYGRVGTASMESEEEPDFPSSLSRFARQEAATNRLANPKSRLPQVSSSRRPSASSATRPTAIRDDQSWSTVTSATATSNTNGVREKDITSSQARSMLRRKPTGISRPDVPPRTTSHAEVSENSQSSSVAGSYTYAERGHARTRGVPDKQISSFGSQSSDVATGHVYPELDRYRGFEPPTQSRNGFFPDVPYRLATDLPPPTPLFSGASSQSQLSTFSASPSTRWSGSPGPGPYSRDTTPTSIASQSPGLVAPLRLPAAKLRQGSPADSRPPVTRRRAGSISHTDADPFGPDPSGLAAVREALTSSSSNSTVKNDDRNESMRQKTSASSVDSGIRKSPQKLQKFQKESFSQSKTNKPPAKTMAATLSPTQIRRPSTDSIKSALPSPQQRPGMPSRPSRDGTPDLYSQLGGPMPIIHSNLSTSSVAERRQSGQLQSSSIPRTAEYASSSEMLVPSRPVTTKITKSKVAEQAGLSAAGQQKSTRTPSPSVPSFRSRFPLFGRKQKSSIDEQHSSKTDRPTRKGPAAGTGHEGYARLGAAKRRSSSGVPPSHAASSESLTKVSTSDTFLLDRLNPVVIAGGEIVENRNNSTELSRTNIPQSRRPSVDTRKGSTTSLVSRPALAPSALPRTAARIRRPSDSSDTESVSMKSTLAFRRSVQREHSPDKAPVKIPKPIVTRGFASPSIDSVDTTILSDDSFSISQTEMRQGALVPVDGPKKLTKKVKSPRKWNIFGRSQGSSSKETKKAVEAPAKSPIKLQPSKPVAFYTMMDSSEQEDSEEPRVEDILKEAEVLKSNDLMVQAAQTEASGFSETIYSEIVADLIPIRKASLDIPSPQPAAQKSTVLPPSAPATQSASASTSQRPKPSRLPQVGRIPKVIKSRPEHTSPKSFSRPFHRLSVQAPAPESTEKFDNGSMVTSRSPQKQSTPEAMGDDATDIECSEDEGLDDPTAPVHSEFMAFSPRKNSETTTCTSSSSYVNHTAITPQPAAPLGEDEIWDEYNDFMGEPPLSATSSLGTPFHLERYDSRLNRKRSAKTAESPTIKFQLSKEFCTPTITRDSVENGKAFTASSHYSADMTARINAAFRFGPDAPSTPFSMTEFVSGYSDRNVPAIDEISAAPASTAGVVETADATPLTMERSESSPEHNINAARNSSNSSSSGSRSSWETPLAQVNLRVGSMTVSKWLTFGQVLFSPVRDDLVNAVGSLKRHAILVIDGLGNDDWSFYAAETYPAATFFNLSPRAPIAKEQTASSFPLSPPNHHQIQFNSHLDKFPFGPETFTSVVFRFPAAAPESHFNNIISESRRVLKPGGYIELSILDADLNNVGTRTRRAARRLKERVAAKHPDYSLGSTSDTMLRLLGRKGFTDVKTCRVGVPVASAATGTQLGERPKKDERSLAEMMRDETENGDENITKMVSKVGRWWYNRCYESSTGVKGIWCDKAVLAECEQWGTSLKLMVCHARIPEGSSRHASL
ncbi:gliotoxin biosynthesis N-methyltransferase [Microdochium nivale]|nr:gliotoxin biosynthesis N-methyltransferase [Microdochium nivale]